MPETLHPLGSKKKRESSIPQPSFPKALWNSTGGSRRISEALCQWQRQRGHIKPTQKLNKKSCFSWNERVKSPTFSYECKNRNERVEMRSETGNTRPGATAGYNYRGGKAVRLRASTQAALHLLHQWYRWAATAAPRLDLRGNLL